MFNEPAVAANVALGLVNDVAKKWGFDTTAIPNPNSYTGLLYDSLLPEFAGINIPEN